MKRITIATAIIVATVFAAATVYDVELSFNDNFNATQVRQTFIATADSISEASFFCGRKIVPGRYEFQIRDSLGYELPGNPPPAYSDSAGLFDYKLVSATFSTKVYLRKGFKYSLVVSHSQDSLVNFYYNRCDFYPDGELIGHPGCDLAARIYGVNNFPKDLFGMNSCMTVTDNQAPNQFRYPEKWHECIDSMKATGIKWDRNGHCAWQHFQFESDDIDSFHYGWCDSLMHCYAQDSINVFWLFTQSTRWASCTDSIDTLVGGVPGHEWYDGLPKNLFKPVLIGNQINPENYFAQYVYKFVKRYGPNGDFWDTVQTALRRPIKYYDMWNEPEWALGKDSSGIQIHHYWCNDSVTDPYYDSLIQADNSNKKKGSLMRVYSRLCIVGDSASKKAATENDAQDSVFTIIYLPYWGTTQYITTEEWLDSLHQNGVQNFCQGVSFHTYAIPEDMPPFHNRQKLNLDYVWQAMRNHGFGDKFLWCTEHSTGCFDTTYDSIGVAFPVQTDEHLATITTFYVNNSPKGPLTHSFHWGFSTRWYPDIYWDGRLYCLARDNFAYRPPGYGYRQLTSLLSNCRFNQCLVSGSGYDTIRVYEFENPQINRKMYVGWKERNIGGGSVSYKLPMRTNAGKIDSVAYDATPGTETKSCANNGWLSVALDTSPLFIYEPADSTVRRPDLVIDSIWTNPAYPRDGDSVTVYAMLKNIDAIQATMDTIIVKYYNNDTLFVIDTNRTLIKPKKSIVSKGHKKIIGTKGNNILKIVVNPTKKFVESNFSNNTTYKLLNIP